MAVRLSALRARRPLPLSNTQILLDAESTQGHSVAGRIRSIEKFHRIGSLNHDLPACSIVPQSTTLPRIMRKKITFHITGTGQEFLWW
jgi:hypothetical protein